MSVKSVLTNHLSPSQMKKIKWSVMQMRYLKSRLHKKCDTLVQNKAIVEEVATYSLPHKHVFFGYYDLQQFDKEKKRLLVHVVDEKKCDPAKDKAEINYINVDTNEFVPVTNTSAWSWQQGARLRWHPTRPDHILFNDMRDGHYVTIEWDINEKKPVTIYPVAFYDITTDASYGLSLNFSRLQRLRPGYGYSTLGDSTVGESVPEGDGIFRYDIKNEKSELLISLEDLADKVDTNDDVEHYINHISISPSGRKFLFFHLWTSVKTAKWDMRLYVADIITGKYECIEDHNIISHYCWKDDRYIIATTAAMNGETPQYIEYDLEKKVANIQEGDWLHRDGHPSYIHGSRDYISDTYPVGCMQYVFRQHESTGTEILRVYSDPRLFDDMRCDLHPRITPDNAFVTIDTTYKNRVRQVISLKMRNLEWQDDKEHFLIVGLGNKNNAVKEMFYEVIEGQVHNAEYVEPFVIKNRLVRAIHKVVFSRKFRAYFRWLPHEIWEKYHVLRNIKLDEHEKNYVILTYGTDIERLHFSKLIADTKKKMGDSVCFVLMLFDPLSTPLKNQGWENIQEVMKEFDIVATFDEQDAKQYGLVHFTDPYAKRKVKVDESIPETDIFFVGAEKGRGKSLHALEEIFVEFGVKSELSVVGLDKSLEIGGLTNQRQYMTYDETLQHVAKTNCLLEVLCDGQNSSSLRYYEAVVYGKKLLSNNPNIVKMPYYNPEYMKVFKNVDDIDFDWVKEKCEVDYQYEGDFSISKFLDQLTQYGG